MRELQMDRVPKVTSEADLAALIDSLNESEREGLAERLIELCLAANCTGHVAATTSDYLESAAREALSFGLNKPAAGSRCLGAVVVLGCLFPSSTEVSAAESTRKLLLHVRYLLLWQLVLAEPAVELKKRLEEMMSVIDGLSLSTKDRVVINLEMYHGWMRYYERDRASDALSAALAASGLQLELTGRMGKRTRYQQKELAQLVLDLKSSSAYGALSAEEEDCDEEKDVPVNVTNQDDTLLQRVTLTGEDTASGPPPPLTSIHLALLLAACSHERQTEHHDELRLEKCDAYLEQVICRRRCWSAQAAALALRASLESSSKRRVERACQQMEHLVHLQMAVEPALHDASRLLERAQLALATGVSPVWRMREAHARILISLGCVPEALLVFEALEEWDQVVECYKRLGQLEKAEGLLRRLLEERREVADILCSLGDITNKREYYDRAITCSSDRSARAHRSLGMLYLNDRKHADAYTHFKRSLELQPIQLGVWFNAGHCAWKDERFQEAVSAYHRCTSLEPEHFEAWNNLAAAYTRMGQKERAARILFEALKFNYEHANVWENYMLLCVDCQNQRGALLALDRLADLKKKVEDDEALEALVEQIALIDDDMIRRETRESACKTFGHLAASQQLSGRQWRAYAKLRQPTESGESDADKYTTLMEKAASAFNGVPKWERDSSATLRVLESALTLARHRIACGTASEAATNQARVRVRMSLRQIVTLLDKAVNDGFDLSEEVQKGLEETRELLSSVV